MTDNYELTFVGTIQLKSQPTRMTLSDQGDYLVVSTQSGELLYYNWKQDLLWSGQMRGEINKMAVSSDKQRIAIDQPINDTPTTYALDKSGNLIWSYASAGWEVHDLYLNGAQPLVVAAKQREVANLGSLGNAVWSYSTSEPVKSLAIGMNGAAIAFGTDKAIGCLDARGNLRWRFAINDPTVHLYIGLDRIVGADCEGKVYCLDVENGQPLVIDDLNEDIHGLAISGSGRLKLLTIATGHSLRVVHLGLQARLKIRPILEERTGIANVLEAFAPDEVYDLRLNANRNCMIVEQESAFSCFTLEGKLLWHCNKIEPRAIQERHQKAVEKKPVRRRTRQPTPSTPPKVTDKIQYDPLEILQEAIFTRERKELQGLRSMQSEFIKYTQEKSVLKAPKLQTQTKLDIGPDILDVYFDGRGYLFVHKTTDPTLSKAMRLAQKTDIFIVTYHATDKILQTVKGVRSVEIFRIKDMVKTCGGRFGGKNEFEKFYEAKYHKQFQKK